MKSKIRIWFAGLLCVGLGVPPVLAAGVPLINGATVDYAQKTLTISGQNFGSNPAVTLNTQALPTVSATSNQIVASFPTGNPPLTFTPGTYFLLLTYRNQVPSVFAVDIGANGPQGVAGLQGPAGAPGAMGAVGPAGPVGPAGAPGPMGPAGLAGTTGPAGPQGTPGVNGTGVPICTTPNIFLVIDKGGLACQTPPSRYVDNGDGTITDNQTGLMWENKDGVCGTNADYDNPHCIANTYQWGSSLTARDGTLFTDYLAQLNLDLAADPASGSCFANHCDWRIPKVSELRSILISYPCSSSPCTDAIFGPWPTRLHTTCMSAQSGAADEHGLIGSPYRTSLKGCLSRGRGTTSEVCALDCTRKPSSPVALPARFVI